MLIAEVAIPVPLAQAFSYSIPEGLDVVPGVRVVCPFGPRRLLGVVLDVHERDPSVAPDKLRAISSVVDVEPALPTELLAFLRELSAYYLSPIGEVMRLALPALERGQLASIERAADGVDGAPPRGALGRVVARERVRLVRALAASATVKLGPRANALLERVRAAGEVPVTDLTLTWKGAPQGIRRLRELGLVEIVEREAESTSPFGEAVERDRPPELTPAQAAALDPLSRALSARAPGAYLLHGVTGSGKTEVYLRAIAVCLASQRGAIVLVPEIALTPQLVARFRARFGDELAVLHSGVADRERYLMWQSLRTARVRVAIGARSALFAPVRDLGLVVVDEEHDPSFKQEEGPRYHARDMALLRAHRAGAVALLGSATPSLESEMLARRGKLTRLELPNRAHASAELPTVELVDLRRIGPGPSRNPLLSLPLHRALERTLAAGEQAILFLNRRGFAPSVVCYGCGEIVRCQACSVALTHHRARGGTLVCHYCDFSRPMPRACDTCGAPRLELEGVGTERLEETLAAAFPSARVARLDRDVAAGERAEEILQRMRAREIDILVGTQMVTKGHDLPAVTLVGVVNADASLSIPDFRASERTFQLLVQVAGRAGRRERRGLVLVQTRDPDNPAIVAAAAQDVRAFTARELANREELDYPPFSHLALVRVDALDERRAENAADALANAARASAASRSGEVDVVGPAPAPIPKVRARFRFRVMLRARERRSLRAALGALLPVRDGLPNLVRVVVDIDPVQMM